MRVLQVAACPYPSPQGSQVYVRGTARALADAGHDVIVAAYGHGVGPADPRVSVVRTPHVPGYQRMRSGPDPVKPLLDLAVAAVVARTPADIVHAHNYEGLAAALLARRYTGTPVVYAAHTLLEDELPTDVSRGRGAWRRLGGWVDRALPRQADAVLALSAQGAAALQRLGCRRVVHIPPGLHPGDYVGVRPRRLSPGPTLVYAGTSDTFQDLDVLYAAMEALPGVTLLVVSHGGPLGERASSVGARVVHPADWQEARDWIAGADVAAVPRTRCAGFPMKLLNYLALGLPTVVAAGSAQGLPGEIVVPNGDSAAFAAGVRAALGGAGRPDPATLQSTCAWATRAAEITGLYADVLRNPLNGRDPASTLW